MPVEIEILFLDASELDRTLLVSTSLVLLLEAFDFSSLAVPVMQKQVLRSCDSGTTCPTLDSIVAAWSSCMRVLMRVRSSVKAPPTITALQSFKDVLLPAAKVGRLSPARRCEASYFRLQQHSLPSNPACYR